MTRIAPRRLLWAAAIAVGVALIAVYALFDPAHTPFPRCLFLQLTGLKCPGCGSQRAVHSLLHGDIAAAWDYNALLVASIPFVGLLLISQLLRRRMPRLYNRLNSAAVIWTVFVIVICWLIARNIFGL